MVRDDFFSTCFLLYFRWNWFDLHSTNSDVYCFGLMLWHRNYLLHLEHHSLLHWFDYCEFEFVTYISLHIYQQKSSITRNITLLFAFFRWWLLYCSRLQIFLHAFMNSKLILNGRKNGSVLIESQIKCLWCNIIVQSFWIWMGTLSNQLNLTFLHLLFVKL